MGVSRSRVQALISTGQVAAENVDGRWIVSEAELARWERIPRLKGRPLSQQRSWHLIEDFDQGRRDVGELAMSRGALSARSKAIAGRVLPECLSMDGVPVEYRLGGPTAAAEHGAAVRPAVFDVYIAGESLLDFSAWSGFARLTAQPNLIVHTVESSTWPHLAAGLSLVVAWLDLADAGDRGAAEAMFALQSRHAV